MCNNSIYYIQFKYVQHWDIYCWFEKKKIKIRHISFWLSFRCCEIHFWILFPFRWFNSDLSWKHDKLANKLNLETNLGTLFIWNHRYKLRSLTLILETSLSVWKLNYSVGDITVYWETVICFQNKSWCLQVITDASKFKFPSEISF